MTMFLIYFAIVALGVAWFLSRADWAKMLALVPVGALVPAFFGTASNCGPSFALHLFEPGVCATGQEAQQVFAAYFVMGIIAVLPLVVLVKLGRMALGVRRGGE
jgi:hypothetical protein